MAIRASYKWLSRLPGSGRLPRRALLLGAAALRAQKPETIAFDLSLLDDASVPNELFFVREHFPQPAGLSAAGWKIGSVSLDELLALPRRTLPAAIECAENPVGGGLVSQAEWSGCPLAAVLEKSPPAPFVRLTGADGFSHTVPYAKAAHPGTLLAINMNGEKLPVQHGFPVRAIVPGWYGAASVKWLQRVELLADEPAGSYIRQTRSLLAGVGNEGAVQAGGVKSVFSRPMDGAILTRRGGRFVVRGVAWAGERKVRSVEVSADAGKTWLPARLDDAPSLYAWARWSWEWKIAGAGEFDLSVRATDDQGRQQPQERASNRIDNYEWDSWQTIHVTVS